MELAVDIIAFIFYAVLILGVLMIIAKVMKKTGDHEREIQIKKLNHNFNLSQLKLAEATLEKKQFKKKKKEIEKSEKSKYNKNLFLAEFDGDVKASSNKDLAKMVSALLKLANKNTDEIVIKIKSPGGMVNAYGLASSQLKRLKDEGIPLTVCVDEVAASGGYLMACLADKIICAPFAIIGSIGVVSEFPNFNKFLTENHVDYKQYTAGKYKRTVGMLSKITREGEKHFKDKLESTHQMFKDVVTTYRTDLEADEVCTGDYWYGEEALEHKLVDEIKTSDEYVESKMQDHNVFKLGFEPPGKMEKLLDKFSSSFSENLSRKVEDFFTQSSLPK